MKLVFSLAILLAGLSSQAQNFSPAIYGRIQNVFCGEMDPFAVGDACVVFVKEFSTNKKLGLVYRDYDWMEQFLPMDQEMDFPIGNEVNVHYCEKIGNRAEVQTLKDYDSEYFYLNCSVDGFSFYQPDNYYKPEVHF